MQQRLSSSIDDINIVDDSGHLSGQIEQVGFSKRNIDVAMGAIISYGGGGA